MELKTKAIVVSSVSKGEADKRVRLFSLDEGMIEATVRGVKKQGAKLVAATFDFSFVEVVLAEKNGFYTVTSAEAIEPFSELLIDLERYQLASSALEIVSEFIRGETDKSAIFVEVLNLFKLLSFAEDGTDLKLVWCKWVLDVLSLSGYKLSLSVCSVCAKKAESANSLFMDMESGSVFCETHRPLSGIMRDITSGIFKILTGLMRVSLSDMNGRSIKDESISSEDVFEFVRTLLEGIMGKKLKSIIL